MLLLPLELQPSVTINIGGYVSRLKAGTTMVKDVAHFVSGHPESFADGNALSPGTTASCL
jgi:hypothetical protein